jgi:tetratricopeptide (TPR) repeat protein
MDNTQGEPGITSPGVTQLFDRATIFMEDGDFKSANEYLERVLDLDPHNARAYFSKLLVSLQLRHEEDILSHNMPLDDYGDYQKALRFADEAFKQKLEAYNSAIVNGITEITVSGVFVSQSFTRYEYGFSGGNSMSVRYLGKSSVDKAYYDIYIDNKLAVTIPHGNAQKIPLQKGKHTIWAQLRIKLLGGGQGSDRSEKSNIIEFEMNSEPVSFNVRSDSDGKPILREGEAALKEIQQGDAGSKGGKIIGFVIGGIIIAIIVKCLAG